MRSRILLLAAFGLMVAIAGCAAVPGPGDPAPPFTATLDSGEEASLTDLMGEKGVVLYFYPKDETPGCITQACTFRDRLSRFDEQGFNVVGVSLDTMASHEAFKAKHNLNFKLISDTDKSLATLYNVPLATDPHGTKGFKRTTFVIAKNGLVLKRFDIADPEKQVEMALQEAMEITY